MVERVFGAVPGVQEGDEFESRRALSAAGVHRPLRAGISGTELDGADSIVLSGGYEDDRDEGDVILYTGQGGRDLETGRQVAHQHLTPGNLALARSRQAGRPVRVTRGHRQPSPHAPSAGYRYAGLYTVEDFWHETGRSGHRIWRFRLVKVGAGESPGSPAARRVKVLRDCTCHTDLDSG